MQPRQQETSSKSQVIWTKEEEKLLKLQGANLSSIELTKIIPRHTANAIAAKRKRFGIEVTEELRIKIAKYARNQVNPDNLCFTDVSLSLNDLSNNEYQMLIGSILGDGCVKMSGGKGKRFHNYYEGHGSKQSDYLKWKLPFFEKFKPILTESFHPSNIAITRPEMFTCSHPIFSHIRNLVYGPNEKGKIEKRFPHTEIISKLDEFGLLIWYLDDGYAGNRPGHKRIYPSIAVKSMDIPSLQRAVEIVNQNMGLDLYIYQSKWKNSTNRVIKFTAASRDIILPKWQQLAREHHLPQSMWYKFGLDIN